MQSSSANARYLLLPNVAQQKSKHSWAFHSSVVNNSPLCANDENESNVCKSERRPVRKCYTAKHFSGPSGLATLACSNTKPTSPTLKHATKPFCSQVPQNLNQKFHFISSYNFGAILPSEKHLKLCVQSLLKLRSQKALFIHAHPQSYIYLLLSHFSCIYLNFSYQKAKSWTFPSKKLGLSMLTHRAVYIWTFPTVPLHPWVIPAHQGNSMLLQLVSPRRCRDKIMPKLLFTSLPWIICKSTFCFTTKQILSL